MTNKHDHPLYQRWRTLKSRMHNPKYQHLFPIVCERWEVFDNFVSDVGMPPFEGAELDRINNTIGYTPDNCRWVTRSQNCLNRRLYIHNDRPMRNIRKQGNQYRVGLHVRGRSHYEYTRSLESAIDLRNQHDYEKLFHSLLGL